MRWFIYICIVFALLLLSPTVPALGQRFIEFSTKYTPDFAENRVGQSVVYLGDFLDIGQGIDILAFGDPDAPGGGAIWLSPLGGPDVINEGIRLPDDIVNLEEGDKFGHSIALLEDLDGNGVPELAVGAINGGPNNNGAVWILYLSRSGDINFAQEITEEQMGFVDNPFGNQFGYAVAGVTGLTPLDNETVLVISAPSEATGDRTAPVYACFLSQEGVSGCRQTFAEAETEGNGLGLQRFGSAIVQIGPPNGINVPLAIGASRFQKDLERDFFRFLTGRIYFYNLAANGRNLSFDQRSTYDDVRSTGLGESLVAPGDIDGDGCNDLIGGGTFGGFIQLIALNCNIFFPVPTLAFSQQLEAAGAGTSLTAYRTGSTLRLYAGTPFDTDRGAIHSLALYDPLPPLGVRDEVTVFEDEIVSLPGLFDNDRLLGLPPWSARAAGSGQGGRLLPEGRPIAIEDTFSFSPEPDFFGTTTVSYRVFDSRFVQISDSPYTFAQVEVTVLPTEDAPRIDSLATLTAEANTLYNQQVRVFEVDGDPISVSILKKPEWLATAVSGDSTEYLVTLVGTPGTSDAGTHEVILFADDGKGTTTRSFIITVPAEPLAAPALTVPANGAEGVPVGVQLAWDPVPGATTYLVELSSEGEFSSNVQRVRTTNTATTFDGLEGGTTYFWRVQASSPLASGSFSEVYSFTTSRVSTVSLEDATPYIYQLAQNYPNPFNLGTVITYELAEAGPVKLTVYDVLGREVARLVEDVKPAGLYEAVFEAGDFPTGIYMYKFTANAYVETKQMILVR